jgi:signal peptidase I
MLLVLAFAIFAYLNFKTVEVQGRSMFPTFRTGQRVLVSKAYWLVGPIRDNDVVVLTDTGPTGYIIKRVMWSGGEKVDWKWVPDNYRLELGALTVPPGFIYVLGDNRPESEDSRKFGPRDLKDVIGKVIVW